MDYPIVETTTKDDLPLNGLLLRSKKKDAILINIHGTAGNFYDEEFTRPISELLLNQGISVLWTNNRGSLVLQAWPLVGSSQERFEDCILDIDAWISYALSLGYKEIILQGHSIGTEKIVYYMNKGRFRKKVKAIILLSFADSYGTQMEYVKSKRNGNALMREAISLVKAGKGRQMLTSDWLARAGLLQQGADAYMNLFTEGSELSKALPLRNGKGLPMFWTISVPILAVIGDNEEKEYTIIPIRKAIDLLKKENANVECHQIKGCDHVYTGKEKVLAGIISSFLRRKT